MRLIEIDVKDEYQKAYGEDDGEILDFILSRRLYPRRLYYPAKAFLTEDPLFILPDHIFTVRMLRKEETISLQRVSEDLFGSDVIIKNEDEILEETGELVIAEDTPSGDAKIYEMLERLYPGKMCAYQALDALKVRGKSYQILVQVGFVRGEELRIEDNLPPMDGIVLPKEKPLIYPLFGDLLKRMLLQSYSLCFNWVRRWT